MRGLLNFPSLGLVDKPPFLPEFTSSGPGSRRRTRSSVHRSAPQNQPSVFTFALSIYHPHPAATLSLFQLSATLYKARFTEFNLPLTSATSSPTPSYHGRSISLACLRILPLLRKESGFYWNLPKLLTALLQKKLQGYLYLKNKSLIK